MAELVELTVEPLAADTFEPFGRVIERPRREHDASGPGWSWWAETVSLDGDDRPWGIGYLDLQPAPLRFDWAERHLRRLEEIVPLDGDVLVYVARAGRSDEPGARPPLDEFRVFRVPGGSGVVLHRGVWHGAPLAEGGAARAIVLILEGTGTNDVDLVRFDDAPVLVRSVPQEGSDG
jgi:ureidoglycolate hydrolase